MHKFLIPLVLAITLPNCPIPTPTPTPTPSPTPTIEPTPTPTPSPTPTPTPTPVPTPTPSPTPSPTPTVCPPLSSTAVLFIKDKPSGHGFDSTLRVKGDAAFCKAVTGQDGITNCSLEGWPQRAACEMALLGGCPVWQYVKTGEPTVYVCHDDHVAWASCDHFGSPNAQDDPQTPTTGNTLATLQGFEGQPLACGLQRDAYGPFAGFFTVAHGKGQVRACFPNDPLNCGDFFPFDH